ncbi:MAG TPA: hypothetical protein VEZ70_03510 [Allosphingosinicella sp.]|nr:hypothetical protein [Allosphingosinicella sp.]
MNSTKAFALGLLTVALSGCGTMAPSGQIAEVTTKFSDIVKSSSDTLLTETGAKTSVRRDEVLMHYISRGDNPGSITRAGVPRSFANYVCVGSSSLVNQTAFLDYSKAYSDALAGITKPGASTFAGQWKKYQELKKADTQAITPPEQMMPGDLFEKCTADVSARLTFEGVPASDFTNESAIGFVLGLEQLVRAVETTLATGLKVGNEIESRRMFSRLVIAQHEDFQSRLSNDLRPDLLDNAWERRKSRALWRPYRTFARMMELDPARDRAEIYKLADETNAGLAEFDALRKTKSPATVVKSLAVAENAIYEVATNEKLSPRQLLSFLASIATDLEQIGKDYKGVKEAADKLGGEV